MKCPISPLHAWPCAIALLLSPGICGQITEVGTANSWLLVTRAIPTAGVKLYEHNSSSLTLYNLDLSEYATIDFPALPVGHSYFGPQFMTESTFDTDPQSIELVMMVNGPNSVLGTRVFRDDGTILLDELGHTLNIASGSELGMSPPLFVGEDGITYLSLTTYPTNPPASTKLFQLPGTLPCIECEGGIVMGLPLEAGDADPTTALLLFPNPAADDVALRYTLPEGTKAARLLVRDAQGRLVANLPLTAAGHAVLSMAGHANGQYACSLVADGRVVRTEQLMLAR